MIDIACSYCLDRAALRRRVERERLRAAILEGLALGLAALLVFLA